MFPAPPPADSSLHGLLGSIGVLTAGPSVHAPVWPFGSSWHQLQSRDAVLCVHIPTSLLSCSPSQPLPSPPACTLSSLRCRRWRRRTRRPPALRGWFGARPGALPPAAARARDDVPGTPGAMSKLLRASLQRSSVVCLGQPAASRRLALTK